MITQKLMMRYVPGLIALIHRVNIAGRVSSVGRRGSKSFLGYMRHKCVYLRCKSCQFEWIAIWICRCPYCSSADIRAIAPVDWLRLEDCIKYDIEINIKYVKYYNKYVNNKDKEKNVYERKASVR